jgi:tetratricopeptide (TPR) repeat protein
MLRMFAAVAGLLVCTSLAHTQVPDCKQANPIFRETGCCTRSPANANELQRRINDCTKFLSLAGTSKVDQSIAYLVRGRGYALMGQLERAFADFDKAVELDPRSVHAYLSRGREYQTKRQFDRAMADFHKAIELNPSSEVAFRVRGSLHYSMSQFHQAIADYDRAIELDPHSAQA